MSLSATENLLPLFLAGQNCSSDIIIISHPLS